MEVHISSKKNSKRGIDDQSLDIGNDKLDSNISNKQQRTEVNA